MDKKLKKLEELIKLFVAKSRVETREELFFEIDKFFQKNFKLGPLMIISVAENYVDQKVQFERIRKIWSKDEFELTGKDFNLLSHLNGPLIKDFVSDQLPSTVINENGSSFIFINIGVIEKQLYIGMIRILDHIDKDEFDVINHTVTLLRSSFQQIYAMEAERKLSSLAYKDDVTGLYNQRKLHRDLDNLIGKYHKFQEHFSLIFIDIDYFKKVNDQHGHLVGSYVLVEVSKILQEILRLNDLIYRYGGDEFVVILPDTKNEVASAVGKRILESIREYVFVTKNGTELNLTVSIGIAEFPQSAKTKNEIMQIADDLMYKAKEGGRNRVCTVEDMFKKNSA